ncbi:uncharacterized protein PAC_05534 [Phialocephala subalpina]|uniref:F-box domain-containing protein n=1 Tax=Phialocephala subalpina TaxID=576137 RepID=A0A1L7WSA1_9HELO|nr:uncharacterized protein PAC_05534 [Phialocephala subalpina]
MTPCDKRPSGRVLGGIEGVLRVSESQKHVAIRNQLFFWFVIMFVVLQRLQAQQQAVSFMLDSPTHRRLKRMALVHFEATLESTLQNQLGSIAHDYSRNGQEAAAPAQSSQSIPASPNTSSPREPCKNVLELPLEMVRHIATFLPASSAAAFAPTSRATIKTLGTDSFKKLRIPDTQNLLSRLDALIQRSWNKFSVPCIERCCLNRERLMFLRLLDKDISDMVICFLCHKFHNPVITNAKSYTEGNCNYNHQQYDRAGGRRELKLYWA